MLSTIFYLMLLGTMAEVPEKTKFEKIETFFTQSIENLEKEEFYNKASFSKDEKNVFFKDLNTEEKDHYYILRASLLSRQMEEVYENLKCETDDEEALIFMTKLLESRKKLALLQENLISKKAEKYPDLKIYLEEVTETNKQKKLTK